MDRVFLAYESAKENTIRGDFIDKLHSKITVVFLFVLCILIGIKQYDDDGQNQIVCWLPTHFSDEQVAYAHQLCWVNNTYYYPEVTDADLFPESSKDILLYYQYILFILFGQAMLFFLPTMIWELLAKNSVGYIKKILDQVQRANMPKEVKKPAAAKRIRNLKGKTSELDDSIEDQLDPVFLNEEISKKLSEQFKTIVNFENELTNENNGHEEDHFLDEEKEKLSRKEENREQNLAELIKKTGRTSAAKVLNFMKPLKGVRNLAFHYIFLKVLNLLNVVVQMFILNFIFGNKFFTYGIDFITSLVVNQNPFFLTTQFPIITFCDFFVHQNLRKIYYNSAQCILPINVLIEKFFLLVWFWYYLLIVLTTINIIAWILDLLTDSKFQFLSKYLEIRRNMQRHKETVGKTTNISIVTGSQRDVAFENKLNRNVDVNDVKSFYRDYFGNDGLVMLHMIKSVAGDIIFMDLLNVLWRDYNVSLVRNKEHVDDVTYDPLRVEGAPTDNEKNHED